MLISINKLVYCTYVSSVPTLHGNTSHSHTWGQRTQHNVTQHFDHINMNVSFKKHGKPFPQYNYIAANILDS